MQTTVKRRLLMYWNFTNRDKDCTLEKASEELKNNPVLIELSNNGQNSMSGCFCLLEKISGRLDENFSEVLETAMKTVSE